MMTPFGRTQIFQSLEPRIWILGSGLEIIIEDSGRENDTMSVEKSCHSKADGLRLYSGVTNFGFEVLEEAAEGAEGAEGRGGSDGSVGMEGD
jgi:hypothetical protein